MGIEPALGEAPAMADRAAIPPPEILSQIFVSSKPSIYNMPVGATQLVDDRSALPPTAGQRQLKANYGWPSGECIT
jgi:hypothetical protein